MKIIRTDIELYREQTFKIEKKGDYCLIILKSPAIVEIDSEKMSLGVNTAVIHGIGSVSVKLSSEDSQLQYDCISFSINVPYGDQFIESMGIYIDKPFLISDDTVIKNIIRCIRIQEFSDENRKNEFLEAAMRMLLLAVSEQVSSRIKMPSSDIPHYRELFSLRNSIYTNPVKEWNIDEICTRLNISSTYFHRIYSAAFGTTCRQDVINSRLALAEKLLMNTDRSIGSIAEECGYENDSYFMRQFKQQRGYTPTEYRRKFAVSGNQEK